jgi:hypothetical protein
VCDFFFCSNGGTYNDQVRERSLESAVTEFQRRFHISVDDIEANRRESNSTNHQVREVKGLCMFVNIRNQKYIFE